MPHLIKKSNKRLLICNKTVKLIEYQKSYFYNFPPSPRKSFHYVDSENKIVNDRRLDNSIRSKNLVKNLVLSNCQYYKQMPLFITFTFADNIDDPKDANPEWTKFIKRFNTFLISLRYQKCKYLTVIEFQKRGAVHYHCLFFNIPFIPNLKIKMAEIWALGFITIKSLKDINDDNHLANYISKYMTKSFSDKKFFSQKNYFTSRGLNKPLRFRNEKDILSILQTIEKENILELVHNEKYISDRYGLVEFTQSNILTI